MKIFIARINTVSVLTLGSGTLWSATTTLILRYKQTLCIVCFVSLQEATSSSILLQCPSFKCHHPCCEIEKANGMHDGDVNLLIIAWESSCGGVHYSNVCPR